MNNLEPYQVRYINEYKELKVKVEKLNVIITKYDKHELDFTLNCPIDLLRDQLIVMKEYLSILEARAPYEKVNL